MLDILVYILGDRNSHRTLLSLLVVTTIDTNVFVCVRICVPIYVCVTEYKYMKTELFIVTYMRMGK